MYKGQIGEYKRQEVQSKDEFIAIHTYDFVESITSSYDEYIKKVYKILREYQNNPLSGLYTVYEYVFTKINNSRIIREGTKLENYIIGFIEKSGRYEILREDMKKKGVDIYVYSEVNTYIDEIMDIYDGNKPFFNDETEYLKVLNTIIEKTVKGWKNNDLLLNKGFRGIDIVFRDKNKKIYMVEVKAKNNKDTGKERSIVREHFIKFAYMVRKYKIQDIEAIDNILLFFGGMNDKTFNGIPEGKKGVMTGADFLETFTEYTIEDVRQTLEAIRDKKISAAFTDGIEGHKECLLYQLQDMYKHVDIYLEKKPKNLKEYMIQVI